MAVIEIEVVSDFVCAWCYIGKRVLDQAVGLHQKTYPGGKDDTFSIKWLPYFLDYNPSPYSIEKSELADVKLGHMSAEQRAALTKRMDRIGRSVGIIFKGGGKIGNTRDAHRLTHLSRSKPPEVQSALVDGLFAAYHELEMDISDKDVLRNLATNAGLDGEEVTAWLESDMCGDALEKEEQQARERISGSGVPTYFVQSVYRVDSAQDVSDFMEAFIKAKEQSA